MLYWTVVKNKLRLPYPVWVTLGVTVVLAIAALAFAGFGSGSFLVPPTGYALQGSFVANGAYTATAWPAGEVHDPAFGSWAGSDANTGSFRSDLFLAPRRINFCVAGYPNAQGISLYLKDTAGQRFALTVRTDPHEEWTRTTWDLPDTWVGRQVSLVAVDDARASAGWIGITLPKEGNGEPLMADSIRAGGCFALLGFQALLFILPGLAIALFVYPRLQLDAERFAIFVFTAAAGVGYLMFWVYFASVPAGRAASFLILAAAGAALWFEKNRSWCYLRCRWSELVRSFVLALLVSALYVGLGYAYQLEKDPGSQAQTRILWSLPPDNVLPNMFAERIYLGQPLRPYLFAEWKSSDRPPLQAGVTLAQYPFWKPKYRALHYQLLAVFLQSLWAPALWLFLRMAGVRRNVIVPVLGFCVFSGFFFLNSYYVWPKLLASALFMFGISLWPVFNPDAKWNLSDAILGAAAIALGLLSHTGVLMAAPGIATVLCLGRKLPPRRLMLSAAAAIMLLWLPWILYQKLYDPPGDLLMKLHLAGTLDQKQAFLPLLIHAYHRTSFHDLVMSKVANFQVLFVSDRFAQMFAGTLSTRLGAFLEGNFFCLFQTLGVLNLALFTRTDSRLRPSQQALRECALANRCGVAAAVSTAIWCLIMFQGGSAVIHQGSLANVFLLFAAEGVWLVSLAPRFAYWLLAVQAVVVFPLFVFAKPIMEHALVPPPDHHFSAAFGAAAVSVIAALCLWGWHTATSSSIKPTSY